MFNGANQNKNDQNSGKEKKNTKDSEREEGEESVVKQREIPKVRKDYEEGTI